jgi:serine/threonine protein kinase
MRCRKRAKLIGFTILYLSILKKKLSNMFKVDKILAFSIISLYGVTKHPMSNEFALVMEYGDEGDLRNYLSNQFDLLNWPLRLDILRSIFKSIADAHEEGIIHCDIHSGNILKNNHYSLTLLTDFGLSKVATDSAGHGKGKGSYGIVPYMAPELLQGAPYSKATDIYALGMVMWELSAGEPPFNDREHDADLILAICDGERPQIVEGTPDCWVQLMTRCWDSDPTKRPTAEDVRNEVRSWRDPEYNDEKNVHALFQLEKAEQYRKENPRPVRKSRHPGTVYSSRFIPAITRENQNSKADCGIVDNDEWDKLIR